LGGAAAAAPAQATAAQAEAGGDSLLQQALDKGYLPATMDGDVQKISATLNPSVYPFIIVQKGVPVELTITADESAITGCNQTVVFPAFDVKKTLKAGDNVIQFTADETGMIPYTCWMGMVDGRILVVDNLFASSGGSPSAGATSTPG
jgi:plastocyanin domain-containing protein